MSDRFLGEKIKRRFTNRLDENEALQSYPPFTLMGLEGRFAFVELTKDKSFYPFLEPAVFNICPGVFYRRFIIFTACGGDHANRFAIHYYNLDTRTDRLYGLGWGYTDLNSEVMFHISLNEMMERLTDHTVVVY